MRFGTLRMPLDQTALFNFTSTRTSDVFIIFCANVLICVWLIQEVKGVLSQFLFRVFWGLAPEHNFPSSLSLGRVAEEHERTRTTRKYATNAQINTPRVRFARFARLSQVATGSIFRDFKCVFLRKNLRVYERKNKRSKFARRRNAFSEITPNEHVPLSPRAELSS